MAIAHAVVAAHADRCPSLRLRISPSRSLRGNSRLLLRPEGLEVVLAENESDPQFPLLSALELPLLAAPGGLCEPRRHAHAEESGRPEELVSGSTASEGQGPWQDGATLWMPAFGVLDDTPVCGPREEGCLHICPEIGVACDSPIALSDQGLVGSADPGSTCNRGRCCLASEVCDGVDDRGEPNRACRNLQQDRHHCGTCGTECPVGFSCRAGICCGAEQSNCDGECVDLRVDHDNCGGCGVVCPTGSSCVASSCSS